VNIARRELLGALAALVACRGARASARKGRSSVTRRIEDMCNLAVHNREAAGIALHVQHGQETLISRGFGYANLETSMPVSPQSVFRIASVSKQFAAASVLLLAEDRKIGLEDKLARFIPEFPRANEVTIRQLLNHTSGLQNISQGVIPCIDYTMAEMLEIIRNQSPLFGFDPGTRWSYSNTGFDLIGDVIERVTGRAFYEFYQERLFARAGMIATAVDMRVDVVPQRAVGYSSANTPTGFVNADYLSWTIPGVAGCLRSTALDLAHWHGALFGGRILSAESLREMTTPSRLNDGRLASEGRTGPAAGTQPVQEYGLGLELSVVDGHRRVGHYGSIPGFAADMGTFPDVGLTVIVLTNTDLAAVNPPRGLDHVLLESL
jgi:D-alanyl-D-alanine carboxypeptidase